MVRVSVSSGLLEGEVVDNEYGGTYYSFKGIPYAQPPIEDLRFKGPQPVKPCTGIQEAKQFGHVSHQVYALDPTRGNMSEDCLYLNVYTPQIKPNKPLPVMFYIHGGGLIWGSGDDDIYGPQFLMRHGVILVTFNYRLNALGFLCLHTAEIPGNAGIKDQVAALKWVKQNIENFGGDSNNITIIGQSAGAGSVSYHLLSNMSKGLFKRAITQSGAATCGWANNIEARDKALLLAKRLGCFSEDDKVLYEFFKKQPVENLIGLDLQICKGQKPYELSFSVVNEKDFGQERFFHGDVIELLRNGAREGLEIMTGYTQDEGIMAIALHPLENLVSDAKFYNEFFVPEWIKAHCPIATQLEVGRKIRKFYFKDGLVTEDGVLQFLNTDMFVFSIILGAKLYSLKNKVYFYKFTCLSERNFFTDCLGVRDELKGKPVVCHGDDLAYLFPVKLVNEHVDQESETFKYIENMVKLWTNFAKYGNPTPDNSLAVQWEPYTVQEQKYLDFGNELKMSSMPDKEEIEFWENIFKEYLPKYTI